MTKSPPALVPVNVAHSEVSSISLIKAIVPEASGNS